MALDQTIIDKAAAVLNEWANEATFAMQKNLEKHGIERTSKLSQSIIFDGTQVTPNGAQVTWNMPGYAVFVDMGVKGLQNRAKVYGNFAFRNMHVSQGFIRNMEDWITRKGVRIRQNRSQTKQSVFDSRKSIAFAMAKSIKKKGLDGTQFYSDVFNESGIKKLTDRLQEALGQQIEINIVTDLR